MSTPHLFLFRVLKLLLSFSRRLNTRRTHLDHSEDCVFQSGYKYPML